MHHRAGALAPHAPGQDVHAQKLRATSVPSGAFPKDDAGCWPPGFAAGHDTPAVRTQLANARTEFNQELATLRGAAISTPAIRNGLELARTQWLFYENALNKASNPESLQTVATTSERVFEVMDNLAALYEAALRDLL